MPTCFVIQPFDSGKYDKRFQDIYCPAIEAAGLEAYRVDKDPTVSVPIDAIEEGIQSSTICLADITLDNPNVWYELGYAFAIRRPVVMVCSEERIGKKYPFDIQHRTIIQYKADAPSDFEELKQKLTTTLKALIEKGESLREISKLELVAPIEGLSSHEISVIVVIAGSCFLPQTPVSVYSCRNDAEQAGITKVAFNLAIRRLTIKKFIELDQQPDDGYGEPYDVIRVTENGWSWLDANDSKLLLHRQEKIDDIPF